MSPRQENTMTLLNVGLLEERLATPDLMIDDDDDSSSCSSDDDNDDDDCSGPDWDWQTLETRTLEEEGYSHKHSIIHQNQYRSMSRQAQRSQKKNVTFTSQTYMVEIISRNDYTPKELKACWYTLEDKQKMNTKHEKYVARFECGKAPKRNQTYRGLECWSIQGAKDLETTITRTIDAVMDEQDRQWMAFKDDYDRLAYVSSQTSEPSKKLAYEMAKLDEQAVKEQYEAEEEEADTSGNGLLQDVSSSEYGSERYDENPIPVVPVSPVSSASHKKKKTLASLRSSSNSSVSSGGSGSGSGSKSRQRRKSSSKSSSSKGGRKRTSSRSSSTTTSGTTVKADPPGVVISPTTTTTHGVSPTTIVKLLPKRTTSAQQPQSLPARTA